MAGFVSDDVDLYAILGVSKHASTSEIKKVRITIAQVIAFSGEHWNILYWFVCKITCVVVSNPSDMRNSLT